MTAEQLLDNRRSIRKFKNEVVNRQTMNDIISLSGRAPSWGNLQVARYTLVEDKNLINRLSKEAVNGFVYNINTLKDATNVCVLSFKKGKSGKLSDSEYATNKN